MFISFYAFNRSFRTITFANIVTNTFDAHKKEKQQELFVSTNIIGRTAKSVTELLISFFASYMVVDSYIFLQIPTMTSHSPAKHKDVVTKAV